MLDAEGSALRRADKERCDRTRCAVGHTLAAAHKTRSDTQPVTPLLVVALEVVASPCGLLKHWPGELCLPHDDDVFRWFELIEFLLVFFVSLSRGLEG